MMCAVLQEVDVPIVSHQQCQLQLQQTRLGYDYRLHQGMICAGGEEGKDACKVHDQTLSFLSLPLVQFLNTSCGFTLHKVTKQKFHRFYSINHHSTMSPDSSVITGLAVR
jgi:hypothetical protein